MVGKADQEKLCDNHGGWGDILTQEQLFQEVAVEVGSLRYSKRCLWALPFLLPAILHFFCYFTALSPLCLSALTKSLAQAKVSLEYFLFK